MAAKRTEKQHLCKGQIIRIRTKIELMTQLTMNQRLADWDSSKSQFTTNQGLADWDFSKSNTHKTSTIWMAMAAEEPKKKRHEEKWRNYRKTQKPENIYYWASMLTGREAETGYISTTSVAGCVLIPTLKTVTR